MAPIVLLLLNIRLLVMNEERTRLWLRQAEHILGHLWNRYSVPLNKVQGSDPSNFEVITSSKPLGTCVCGCVCVGFFCVFVLCFCFWFCFVLLSFWFVFVFLFFFKPYSIYIIQIRFPWYLIHVQCMVQIGNTTARTWQMTP